jgi:hypothetical protein
VAEALTLEVEYDDGDLYDAPDYFSLDPGCSDAEVEEYERAYAEDALADDQLQEWKLERHRAEPNLSMSLYRFSRMRRVVPVRICRTARARSSRSRPRVRRGARTTSSRGSPDDAEPGGAGLLASRAAG